MEEPYKERVTRESVDRAAYWTGPKRSATFHGHAHHYLSHVNPGIVTGGYICFVVVFNNHTNPVTKRGFRFDSNVSATPPHGFRHVTMAEVCEMSELLYGGNTPRSAYTCTNKADAWILGTKGWDDSSSMAVKSTLADLLMDRINNNWRGRQLFRWPS